MAHDCKDCEGTRRFGMTRRDHLVIYKFVLRTKVTRQAFFTAFDEVALVVHAELKRLLVRPIA